MTLYKIKDGALEELRIDVKSRHAYALLDYLIERDGFLDVEQTMTNFKTSRTTISNWVVCLLKGGYMTNVVQMRKNDAMLKNYGKPEEKAKPAPKEKARPSSNGRVVGEHFLARKRANDARYRAGREEETITAFGLVADGIMKKEGRTVDELCATIDNMLADKWHGPNMTDHVWFKKHYEKGLAMKPKNGGDASRNYYDE